MVSVLPGSMKMLAASHVSSGTASMNNSRSKFVCSFQQIMLMFLREGSSIGMHAKLLKGAATSLVGLTGAESVHDSLSSGFN